MLLNSASNLPKVCTARIAIIMSGMKTKDDEASYMIRAHQIMLKKDEANAAQSPFHLMFSVDDESATDEEEETTVWIVAQYSNKKHC